MVKVFILLYVFLQHQLTKCYFSIFKTWYVLDIDTLHYTTLHYTTLHYTTLHYTTREMSRQCTYEKGEGRRGKCARSPDHSNTSACLTACGDLHT